MDYMLESSNAQEYQNWTYAKQKLVKSSKMLRTAYTKTSFKRYELKYYDSSPELTRKIIIEK